MTEVFSSTTNNQLNKCKIIKWSPYTITNSTMIPYTKINLAVSYQFLLIFIQIYRVYCTISMINNVVMGQTNLTKGLKQTTISTLTLTNRSIEILHWVNIPNQLLIIIIIKLLQSLFFMMRWKRYLVNFSLILLTKLMQNLKLFFLGICSNFLLT